MSGYIIALAIGGGAGLLVGLIVTVLNNKPLRQLRRAGREFQRAIRPCCPTAKVFSFGGKHVHPDVWIATVTDAERDKLQQDTNLIRSENFSEPFARVVRPPKCSASEANTYILTSG